MYWVTFNHLNGIFSSRDLMWPRLVKEEKEWHETFYRTTKKKLNSVTSEQIF